MGNAMRMIKKVSIILTLVLCVLFNDIYGVEFVIIDSVNDKIEISADVPADDIYPSDEVYIEYRLPDGYCAYGAELDFSFDKDVLKFKKIELIQKSNDVKEVTDNSEEDKLLYAYTHIGKTSNAENGDLVRLTFTALKSGDTNVKLEKSILIFSDGEALSRKESDNALITAVTIKSREASTPVISKPYYGGGGGGGGASKPFLSNGNKDDADDNSTIVNDNEVKDEIKNESFNIPKSDDGKETEKIAGFSDLYLAEWARNEIMRLHQMGIVNGYNNMFLPNDRITRAEAAKLLCLAMKFEDSDVKGLNFTDVNEDTWYYRYIAIMCENGILNGISAQIFAPEQNVSREEFAVMIDRCIGVKLDGLSEEPSEWADIKFADFGEISDYAVQGIRRLYDINLINGYDNNLFMPQNGLTRAEAVVLVDRIIEYCASEDSGYIAIEKEAEVR